MRSYYSAIILLITVFFSTSLFAHKLPEKELENMRKELEQVKKELQAQNLQKQQELENMRKELEQTRQALQAEHTQQQKQQHIPHKETEQAKQALQARQQSQKEMSAMQKELKQAEQELRKTSRHIAELSRKLGQESPATYFYRYIGNTDRAIIGIIMRDKEGAPEGVEIVGLTPGGPAEKAGLKEGDFLVAVNNKPLKSKNKTASPLKKAYKELENLNTGDKVKLTYIRDKKKSDITLTAKRMEPENYAFNMDFYKDLDVDIDVDPHNFEIKHFFDGNNIGNDEKLHKEIFILRNHGRYWQGLKLADLNKTLGQYFGTDTGVLVLDIQSDLSASLKPGDVILEISGHKIHSPKEAMRILKKLDPGTAVSLQIMRDKKQKNIQITVPEYTHPTQQQPQAYFRLPDTVWKYGESGKNPSENFHNNEY